MTTAPALLGEPLERYARDVAAKADGSSAPTLLQVQERPRSIVAQLEVVGPRGPERVYLKRILLVDGGPTQAKVEQRLLHEQALARRLEAAVAGDPSLGAMRHLALYPDLLTMVTAEVPGEPLVARLERGLKRFAKADDSLDRVMRNIARWLHLYQSLDPPGPAIAVSKLCDYIKVRLDRLSAIAVANWSQPLTAAVIDRVVGLGQQARPGDLAAVPIHADLALGNVLVDGERVTVIDLSMARAGSRYHDLTRLHAQLEQVAMKPWYSGRRLAQLQEALLDAFEPGLTRETPVVELHLLLHRINQFAGLVSHASGWLTNPWDARVALAHRRWLVARTALPHAALCPDS